MLKARRCDCGKIFKPAYRGQELCQECLEDIEHDVNVEMFGADAEYLEIAGLADKIGNK